MAQVTGTTCLVVMAGLPGTGKSAIARLLATDVQGVVLDKDVIRAGLFPEPWIEYSREQDDFCMEILLQVAAYLISRGAPRFVFIDGRPFAFRYQIETVAQSATRMGCPVKIIHTVCSDETARGRLMAPHLAKNRSYDLYKQLKDNFEENTYPALLLDTDEPWELNRERSLTI